MRDLARTGWNYQERRWIVGLTFLAVSLGGCGSLLRRSPTGAVPYTTNPPINVEINQKAKKQNLHGVQAMSAGRLDKAERFFRQSLETDINFGPAHNNLGLLYLARHQLYLAAWEFEYSANLMPDLVEPLINQGLVYETGERLDRAAELYQLAYQRQPHHAVAIASLVRTRIKQDADANEIGFLLDELIMHDDRERWVVWAKQLRLTKYRSTCDGCDFEMESNSNDFPGLEIPSPLSKSLMMSPSQPFETGGPMEFLEVPSPAYDSDLIPVPVESMLAPPGNMTEPLVDPVSANPGQPIRMPMTTHPSAIDDSSQAEMTIQSASLQSDRGTPTP